MDMKKLPSPTYEFRGESGFHEARWNIAGNTYRIIIARHSHPTINYKSARLVDGDGNWIKHGSTMAELKRALLDHVNAA
jgi:hypothetical protein